MGPSPYEQAYRTYCKDGGSPDAWPDILGWHLARGYVHGTPEYFIMGKPVDRFAPVGLIEDDTHVFDEPNAWLVSAAVGKGAYQQFYRHESLTLPWIGWHRRGKLRWYDAEQIKHKLLSR